MSDAECIINNVKAKWLHSWLKNISRHLSQGRLLIKHSLMWNCINSYHQFVFIKKKILSHCPGQFFLLGVLLGDKRYACLLHLLTPYPNQQRSHNLAQACIRARIEMAWGSRAWNTSVWPHNVLWNHDCMCCVNVACLRNRPSKNGCRRTRGLRQFSLKMKWAWSSSHIIWIFYFKLKMPVGWEGIPLHSVKKVSSSDYGTCTYILL